MRTNIRKLRKSGRTKGFTLLEILIVILIIGLIAALVVPNLLGQHQKANVVATKVDIQRLEEILTFYHLDNQHYPSTDQGLEALVSEPSGFPEPRNWGPDPYIKKVPVDPWGNEYIYTNDGSDIEIYSRGADGEDGGNGFNADIRLSEL